MGLMKNRIMTSGVAAVALAASALIALPAAADAPAVRAGVATSLGDNSTLFIEIGHGGADYRPAAYGYGHDRDRGYSQSYRRSRDAIRACRAGIKHEARRTGFLDVDFDSRAWAQRIGRRDYQVRFREVEFEGRRREFERSVTCTVRDGRVTWIDGMPQPGGRGLYTDRGVRRHR